MAAELCIEHIASLRFFDQDTQSTDESLTLGRLYHHLAIVAHPDALRQLCCY
jgi:hypothetical protein